MEDIVDMMIFMICDISERRNVTYNRKKINRIQIRISEKLVLDQHGNGLYPRNSFQQQALRLQSATAGLSKTGCWNLRHS
jgi:hypothetical protein